ncbi:hypothetical protein [Candidatus Similichlamydia epinepheli]|uniref:hypothetical protein n=1 Tax=Candidatus Similichlamydia epinepheli TaxID=1903953 RepID=UPI0013002F50|nr:hypothetical protein [Candidatus Similichlamydia epinepheli]
MNRIGDCSYGIRSSSPIMATVWTVGTTLRSLALITLPVSGIRGMLFREITAMLYIFSAFIFSYKKILKLPVMEELNMRFVWVFMSDYRVINVVCYLVSSLCVLIFISHVAGWFHLICLFKKGEMLSTHGLGLLSYLISSLFAFKYKIYPLGFFMSTESNSKILTSLESVIGKQETPKSLLISVVIQSLSLFGFIACRNVFPCLVDL